MVITIADITTTTAAVFLPTIWSVDVLLAAENALVAANLVRRFDSQVKAKGQALQIPTIANISATAKSANTDVVATSNTETAITLNISSWFYAAVKIEDLPAVQAAYDLRSLYAEKIGYAVAKQVDSKQHCCLKTNSNQWGKSEMTTLNKQVNKMTVQLQRLNEMDYLLDSKRQSGLLSK